MQSSLSDSSPKASIEGAMYYAFLVNFISLCQILFIWIDVAICMMYDVETIFGLSVLLTVSRNIV